MQEVRCSVGTIMKLIFYGIHVKTKENQQINEMITNFGSAKMGTNTYTCVRVCVWDRGAGERTTAGLIIWNYFYFKIFKKKLDH